MVNLDMERTPQPRCRVVILGDTGVGKTALTVRLLTKRFISEYCPTLENIYEYDGLVGLEYVRLQIMDTAGQMDEDTLAGYIAWADCFVLVYSITDRHSFNNIRILHSRIENSRKSEAVHVVLIGNKNDLEHDRKVSGDEGSTLSQCLHIPFKELSAADGCHMFQIAETFRELYYAYLRMRQIDIINTTEKSKYKHSSLRFRKAIQKVMWGAKLTKPIRKTSV